MLSLNIAAVIITIKSLHAGHSSTSILDFLRYLKTYLYTIPEDTGKYAVRSS